MSVKKLRDDFKNFIRERIRECHASIEENNKWSETVIQKLGPAFGGDDDSQICQQQIAAYQALLDDADFWRESEIAPKLFDREEIDLRYIWMGQGIYIFKNKLYAVKGHYAPEKKELLVQDAFDSERRKFERLKNKFSLAHNTEPRNERTGISEEVRIAVWRRDDGKCVRCGSRERLEYDHIIPVSQGGSNTVRNIELLCEACNRSKGANIQ